MYSKLHLCIAVLFVICSQLQATDRCLMEIEALNSILAKTGSTLREVEQKIKGSSAPDSCLRGLRSLHAQVTVVHQQVNAFKNQKIAAGTAAASGSRAVCLQKIEQLHADLLRLAGSVNELGKVRQQKNVGGDKCAKAIAEMYEDLQKAAEKVRAMRETRA